MMIINDRMHLLDSILPLEDAKIISTEISIYVAFLSMAADFLDTIFSAMIKGNKCQEG